MIRLCSLLLALLLPIAALATATLDAPASAPVGSVIDVQVSGGTDPKDFVTIVPKGSRLGAFDAYRYVGGGGELKLDVPAKAGDYEIRWLRAGSPYPTVVSRALRVEGKAAASVEAPTEVVGRSTFSVRWQGPNDPHDYITVVPKGAREGEYGVYERTARGNPLTVLAPPAAGEYEVRYVTGVSDITLASASLRVIPSKQAAGSIRVTASDALAADGAVELILDASGSMLQKLGGQRRIDIAKQTLTTLTSQTIPAGTPFALRVFGREANSCRTDLDLPLAPLQPAAAGARISALEARNGAKTPIGASLAKVADDLRDVRGERRVVLVTDGEETCGGDPAASIETLRKSGVDVRVNIVGFAVDEPAVAATFRRWTDAGGGTYFDARDAKSLNDALSMAVRPAFEIVDAQGRVIGSGVTGAAISVTPGAYTVRSRGATRKVVVQEKEESVVSF